MAPASHSVRHPRPAAPSAGKRRAVPSKGAPPPIIPPRVLAIMLGVPVVAAYFLIPKREELYQRLVQDGAHRRALELAAEAHADEPSQSEETPEQYIVRTFGASDRLAALNRDAEARRALIQAFLASDAVRTDYALLQAHLDELAPAVRDELLRGIGDSALAHNHPDLASEIYAEFVSAHPDTSPEVADQMVRSLRYSGQPAQALAYLNSWIGARDKAGAEVPDDVRLTHVRLLLEMNQPAPAFDALLAELGREKGRGSLQPDTVKLAVQVAGYVNRSIELRPWLADWVSTFPLAKATWTEVRDAAKSRPGARPELLDQQELFRTYGKMLAHWSEWDDHPEDAWPIYRKLAVLGDDEVIDRLASLEPGLYRDEEWLEVLRDIVPVANRPEFTLQLAQLLGIAAEYDDAEKWYHEWLKTHPDDGKTFTELGALREERDDLEAALASYQRAMELRPNDLETRKKCAALSIEIGRHQDALAIYRRFTAAEHDAYTLENYALISESLADYDDLRLALEMRLDRLNPPKSGDFVDVSRAYGLMDDGDGRIAVLERGVKALPKSGILHVELAGAYREDDRLVECMALLEKPWLKDDMLAMSLYVEAACQLDNYDRAYAFLGSGFEKRFSFPADVRLDFGHIYFNTGHAAEAERLYASVNDIPLTWPLLAQATFKRGDFSAAENYQRRHLDANGLPDSDGWMFLGDICRAAGKEAEAQSAYDRALDIMKGKLPPSPGTASVSSPAVGAPN